MLSVLLTFTVTIGIILTSLLLYVLGKLSWLESATNSLLQKMDMVPVDSQAEIQEDPYFYGVGGRNLWDSLTGEETKLVTPLELDEIRARYGIALTKALIKFIQDGIDEKVSSETAQEGFETEKKVLTSRGQVRIWLPYEAVQSLRAMGAQLATIRASAEPKPKNQTKTRKAITSFVCELCESAGLRRGEDVAADVIRAFFPETAT